MKQLALTIFGTFLLLYSVIFHKPPAFFASTKEFAAWKRDFIAGKTQSI